MGLRRYSNEVLAIAIITSLVVGYFAGREHLKYQIASGIQTALKGFSDALGGRTQHATPTTTQPPKTEPEPETALDGQFDFRHTKWGMSKKEVKKSEKTSPEYDSDEALGFTETISGLSCRLIYLFVEDKLVKTRYHFTNTHTNMSDFFDDFSSIKDTLVKKYGSPSKDRTLWKNDTFEKNKNNWGMALGMGHVSMFSKWEMPSTVITLHLSGENMETTFGVEYLSVELSDLFNQAAEKRSQKGL